MMEFLQSHTNVIAQPAFDSPYYSGINPYTLGFNMFKDLRRICENSTDEDKVVVFRILRAVTGEKPWILPCATSRMKVLSVSFYLPN